MKTVLICAIVGACVSPCMAIQTFIFGTHDLSKECAVRDDESNCEGMTQVTRAVRECGRERHYGNTMFMGQATGHSRRNANYFKRLPEPFLIPRDPSPRGPVPDSFPSGPVDNLPPVAVPAPGALVLAGIGTILVGALRRRKAV